MYFRMVFDIKNELCFRFRFDDALKSEVENKVKAEFKDKNYSEILNNIEEIFDHKYRRFLSVFELDSSKLDTDFDEAILKSFMRANDVSLMAELCLSWNRHDIARKFIFTDDYKGDVWLFQA
jgi:hypothetical protein